MKERDFEKEFRFRTSRSSGSGGQHVNKVETRVELWFDPANSALLSEEEKALVLERWAKRLNKEGLLRVVSQESRSQLQNKEKTIEKFYRVLAKALHRPKKRKTTKPSAVAKAKRLADKKQQSEKKALRKKVF